MTKESDRRKAFAFPNAENTLKFTEWLSLEGTSGGQFVQPPAQAGLRFLSNQECIFGFPLNMGCRFAPQRISRRTVSQLPSC